MEQSGQRSVDQFKLKPDFCADGSFKGYSKLHWINSAAIKNPSGVYNNLIHHINEDNLITAFRGLDGSKAVGVDRVTKSEYQKNLLSNIQSLSEKIKLGGWRPKPSREVLIPKPTGGKRPLAVGCLEDKVVQALVAKILEAIYEPAFHRHSYGFRPGKNPHQALAKVYSAINKRGKYTVIVEMDIEKFFNHIDHDFLINFLRIKIKDEHLLRLIKRMLRNSILSENGEIIDNTTGTPQGSPVSPILANIYLHSVLDTWFEENYGSRAEIVRYADDAVFVFDDLKTAQEYKTKLSERFAEFGLKLNEEKSQVVEFGPKQKGNMISFVGFNLYWGKARITKDCLKVQTAPQRQKRAIQNFRDWIKMSRHRHTTKDLWKMIAAKLRGHYNYYAVSFNTQSVTRFYRACIQETFKWLNRRSQKRSFTWDQFVRKIMFNPLPKMTLGYQMKDITTEHGSENKHKTKSRMRKLRTSGSARSSGRQRPLFT